MKMVGIQKKITQLLKLIQQFGPTLNVAIPGLGTIVSSLGSVGEDLMEGANNVYQDYQEAKKSEQKYGFFDGVKSFAKTYADAEIPVSMVRRPSAAMKNLTKSYGNLHPRLQLKSSPDLDEVE
jgi:hypothetical protein